MDNKSIARQFDLIAKLMELHGQNPFKIRSYANAYNSIARNELQLFNQDYNVLITLPAIGKTLAQHIIELREKGKISVLEDLITVTPPGILDILKIKGLGAKKVALIWKELGVESLGELEYACLENRLITLKGFGEKTQQDVLKQIDFLKKSKGSVLLSAGLIYGEMILDNFKTVFPEELFEIAGSLRRKMEVIKEIDILGTVEFDVIVEKLNFGESFTLMNNRLYFNNIPVSYYYSAKAMYSDQLFKMTLPEYLKTAENQEHLEQFKLVPPECLDLIQIKGQHVADLSSILIEEIDIHGIIHAHSKWSDGSHSVEDMANACKALGYKYLVLTDHSVSAFYANGLSEERVLQQWKEIDEINKKLTDFKVYKGIESDILTDGRLDYNEDLLSGFDMIIASVHSVLKMDESTATRRLVKAIEHPATRVLGHLTGRLLLGRPGYPLDHHKIIDACAANNVTIEINANPHRLDIDWRWLPFAMEKGVEICLSPDAHNIEGIQDIVYGVWMARKGGLVKSACINTKDRLTFENWLSSK